LLGRERGESMILKEVKLLKNINNRQFPFSLPIMRDFNQLSFKKPITILVGENGSGKSTFLEGIAASSDLPIAGGTEISQDKELEHAQILAEAFKLSWMQKNEKWLFPKSRRFYFFCQKNKEYETRCRRRVKKYRN